MKLKKVGYKSEPKLAHSYAVLIIRKSKKVGYRYASTLKETRQIAKQAPAGSVVHVFRQDNNFVQAYEVSK